jgi:hypothetical protein
LRAGAVDGGRDAQAKAKEQSSNNLEHVSCAEAPPGGRRAGGRPAARAELAAV